VLVETARTLNAMMVVLATRGEHAARLRALSQYVRSASTCCATRHVPSSLCPRPVRDYRYRRHSSGLVYALGGIGR